jgi:uncharacterized iron-regulated protein
MKTFTQTSDAPYDRNRYRVGDRIVDSWDQAVHLWSITGLLIDVLPQQQTQVEGF